MPSPLKQKIVDAVPEIMAYPGYPYNPEAAKAVVALEKIIGIRIVDEDTKNMAALAVDYYEKQRVSDYIALLKGQYRGRPIRLADVLLAIGKNSEYLNGMYSVDLWARGDLSIGNDDIGRCFWDLSKDNLDDQSPECIAFLEKILL